MSDDANQVLAQYFALDEDGKAVVLAKIQAGEDFSTLIQAGADLTHYTGEFVTLEATGVTMGPSIKIEASGEDGSANLYASNPAGGFAAVSSEGGEVQLVAVAETGLIRMDVADQTRMLISADGIGFNGVTPVTQPAAPVTLGDVIAALQALGLVAA